MMMLVFVSPSGFKWVIERDGSAAAVRYWKLSFIRFLFKKRLRSLL